MEDIDGNLLRQVKNMIVLIDNYDSFTFNLVQYFGDLGAPCEVFRNDKISVEDVLRLMPQGIVISPGPGNPDQAGICLDLIKSAGEQDIPLFGVCLGHQSIGQVFGGNVIRAPRPMHGKISEIRHTNTGIFKGLPSPFPVTRYHSLIVERATLPFCLNISAETDDGLIMALQHKTKPIHGVQFHPESIATAHGHDLIKNFIGLLN
jgi:anthranilate synthase component 2